MAIYYISPTGDDTIGDGSEGSPWYNLFYAVNNSGSTDTIIVKEGTYLQTIGVSTTNIGARTIKSENIKPQNTILDFNGLTVQFISSELEGSIEGIKFIRMKAEQSGSKTVFNSFNGQYIRNCIFEDCRGMNNVRGRGGLFSGGTTTVDNCIFINCWSNSGGINYGGIFSTAGVRNYITTIRNCTFYFDGNNIPPGLFIPEIISIGEGSAPREIIFDNSIVTVKRGTTTFSTIRNNSGTVTVTNSCIHNANYGSSDVTTSTNVVTTDPKFVDPDNNFFDLAVDSPAIGLGQV